MESLRASGACIGLTGTFSVLRDFFGFWRGVIPPDPTSVKTSVSLRQQCKMLHQPHFDRNVISVGSNNFSDADHIELDYNICKIRNIYAQMAIPGQGGVIELHCLVKPGCPWLIAVQELVRRATPARHGSFGAPAMSPRVLSVPRRADTESWSFLDLDGGRRQQHERRRRLAQ
jgi:hypothetical protein